ncbi:uncharacterized protein MONOS_16918 [Monocercomonoides exilis]|uniref:uncharacterized protein n=1 Tax=Monocercomonoides exilis TaxID=2049356 RepID=UPI003559BC52|nr:hypothetical protein MONOS_16918 [Monocercomonoides exilis]
MEKAHQQALQKHLSPPFTCSAKGHALDSSAQLVKSVAVCYHLAVEEKALQNFGKTDVDEVTEENTKYCALDELKELLEEVKEKKDMSKANLFMLRNGRDEKLRNNEEEEKGEEEEEEEGMEDAGEIEKIEMMEENNEKPKS